MLVKAVTPAARLASVCRHCHRNKGNQRRAGARLGPPSFWCRMLQLVTRHE
ncbi:hypothetical protein OK016_27760 [Vibrio chagasii]|nr:hypothetical protein [Vibrio chagasii]